MYHFVFIILSNCITLKKKSLTRETTKKKKRKRKEVYYTNIELVSQHAGYSCLLRCVAKKHVYKQQCY